MQISEERLHAVEKVLKEPVFTGFSTEAWKIRTNLLIAASIALVMGLADIRIAPDSTFLGLKFTGLNDTLIRFTLAAIIVYLLFHFIWAAWDSFLEWRVRITGTRTVYQTGMMWGPEHVDYPVDPRQSSLSNWWAAQQLTIGPIGEMAEAWRQRCEKTMVEVEQLKNANPSTPAYQNLNELGEKLNGCRHDAQQLWQRIEANTKAMTDDRIPTSLKRFDGWFQLFLRSQNLRWAVIEFGAPVIFSGFALYELLKGLW